MRTIPRPPRCHVTWGYHGLTPKVALGESGVEKNSKLRMEGGGYHAWEGIHEKVRSFAIIKQNEHTGWVLKKNSAAVYVLIALGVSDFSNVEDQAREVWCDS